jgi:phosphodiesterase/alkaline phosphatase D-like protein
LSERVPLVLGPLLRHVDEDSACLWVETESPGSVTVRAEGHEATAPTFTVHGHHYALVCVDGLDKGTHYPYTLEVDGEVAWPPSDSDLPPPIIPTLDRGKPLRLAFGSCRTSVTHDAEGNGTHGIDALRAYALRMAGVTEAVNDPDGEEPRWPDLVAFLGDQVYADETTKEMHEFIESRRSIEEPPGEELKDYEEYAHLYKLAWSDPVNRWLLSTLPSVMIFDDHDIRDDWNTSRAWKDEMEATDWWHDRIVAGLASYWVYQHLGNLTPEERAADHVWQEIVAHEGEEGHDHGAYLDGFAERADQEPTSYRWSFVRDLGTQARLVVVDTRAARVLEEDDRSILDDEELAWLDEQMRGDVDHLLVGTSLPFLLAPGLHYVEAFSEALAGGAWGERAARAGEKIRTTVDLEHWAAFQRGFQAVARMTLEVARGERGRAPTTVTFLSGDVHHSYVSEASPVRREAQGSTPIRSRIVQAVCSPIRNPLPRKMRFATAASSYGVAGPIGHVVARSAKVADSPLGWDLLKGPWFDNNLATLEVTDDGLRMWWATGELVDGDHDRPRLKGVADVELGPRRGEDGELRSRLRERIRAGRRKP